VIKSFKHRGLKELFLKAQATRVRPDLVDRCIRRLDRLNTATCPQDMKLPGFNFHGLKGKPKRYSVHVNGPWCITFEWQGENAWRVDLEQYH